MTVEEIRKQVEAAKVVAMRNFERDVLKVVGALRQTIPNSTNPADAARKARAALAK